MTKGKDFQKKQNVNMDIVHQCQRAWCDLNSKGNILKLQHMCPKPKCNC